MTSTQLDSYDVPAHIELPPLPAIADKELSISVRTQMSASSLPPTSGLDMTAGAEGYDKLAHVGDSLLGTAVVLVCQRKFPQLSKGSATGAIVSNYALAQLAEAYGLHNAMIANPSQLASLKNSSKNLANLFEAHVGGVYFDYLTSEKPGAQSDALPAVDDRTDGGAVDYILAWLAPLFEPLIADLHDKLATAPVDDEITDDKAAQGAPMLLNQYVSQRTGQAASYNYFQAVGGWGCTCSVSIGNDNYTASAVRDTRKQAMTVAAHKVALQMGIGQNATRARATSALLDHT